jgi:antitoxin PrlF
MRASDSFHCGASILRGTAEKRSPSTRRRTFGCGRAPIDFRRLSIAFHENVLLERIMTTTITVKGQVTLPKKVRDEVGLKPGDKVEVRATASGGVYIEKQGAAGSYREQLKALAKRRLIKGMTTDEFMEFSRGESAEYRPKAK